jgi:hypothetical protein
MGVSFAPALAMPILANVSTKLELSRFPRSTASKQMFGECRHEPS